MGIPTNEIGRFADHHAMGIAGLTIHHGSAEASPAALWAVIGHFAALPCSAEASPASTQRFIYACVAPTINHNVVVNHNARQTLF